MSRRRNSVLFAVMGCVAFLAGVVLRAVSSRSDATVLFLCSTGLFARAWLSERLSEPRQDS